MGGKGNMIQNVKKKLRNSKKSLAKEQLWTIRADKNRDWASECVCKIQALPFHCSPTNLKDLCLLSKDLIKARLYSAAKSKQAMTRKRRKNRRLTKKMYSNKFSNTSNQKWKKSKICNTWEVLKQYRTTSWLGLKEIKINKTTATTVSTQIQNMIRK